MRVFDAHVHLDVSKANPFAELSEQLSLAGATGCNLIVNTEQEKACLLQQLANGRLPPSIQCVSSTFYHESQAFLTLAARLREEGVPLHVKLHPRLENLTMDVLPELLESEILQHAAVVVIDNLPNGYQLQNHIGTELGLELARAVPARKIVLAHAGGHRLLDCVMLTRNVPNILYDLSFTCTYMAGSSVIQDCRFILRSLWPRIMFGSDYPGYGIRTALLCIRQLSREAGLAEEQSERVFHANAEGCYLGRDGEQ